MLTKYSGETAGGHTSAMEEGTALSDCLHCACKTNYKTLIIILFSKVSLSCVCYTVYMYVFFAGDTQ